MRVREGRHDASNCLVSFPGYWFNGLGIRLGYMIHLTDRVACTPGEGHCSRGTHRLFSPSISWPSGHIHPGKHPSNRQRRKGARHDGGQAAPHSEYTAPSTAQSSSGFVRPEPEESGLPAGRQRQEKKEPHPVNQTGAITRNVVRVLNIL